MTIQTKISNTHEILKKTLCLFTLLFLYCKADAQLVDLGFPANPGESKYYCQYTACNSGNDLWAVLQIYDSTDSKIHLKICKNNGLFWTDYYNIAGSPDYSSELNSCIYNGDLYFNATFVNLTLNSVSYPSMNAIFKWNGTSLTFIDSVKGGIYDMDTFKGKLVITGPFSKVGNNSIARLAQYDGSTWSALGNPANWINFQPGSGSKQSNQIVVQGNKLYITGASTIIDGTKSVYNGLGVYNGSVLSPVTNSEYTNSSFLLGEIYAHPDSARYYSNDSFYKTFYCGNGQSRQVVNNQKGNYMNYSEADEKFAYRGASVFTLKGFISGWPYYTNGFLEKLTGKNIKRIYLPAKFKYDAMRTLGIFGKEKVFMMLDNQNLGDPIFLRLDSNENLSASVRGTVCIDLNNDNKCDWNDKVMKNQWVVAKPGNITVMTNENGEYFLPGLDSGNYTIELIKPKLRLFKNPAGGSFNVSLSLDSNIIRNFALSNDTSIKDISVEVSAQLGWRARRGFTELYKVKISNNSVFTRTGSVSINLDNIFSNMQSLDQGLAFNGNSGTISFNNLKSEESIEVKFTAKSSVSSTVGAYYKIWALADSTTIAWDTDSTNDCDTLYVKMLAACDPNDKISKPEGEIKPGTRHIQYHINFQNVGNDTAYRVVIVDTIDLRVPLQSIVLGSSSHKYKLHTQNNILIFEFPDIKLVDSATNEPGSKGYIRFSAMLQPNLPIGSKVDNRAHIYFDYNEAVITNTASVFVHDNSWSAEHISSIDGVLKVYPNPASGIINLQNTGNECGFRIYNSGGIELLCGTLNNGENILKVDGLPAGIYFVVLDNGSHVKFIIQ